ncbi:MAG: GNAT family N-acetyltransferase [Actinomycetales bacterium]|nr:GNAT family N-acetyltransferase [Actinomycetales bacterium]
MSDITVRSLTEADWAAYRAVRLQALAESPEAFSATVEQERDWAESDWVARLARAPRLVAEVDDEVVGTASLGRHRTSTGPAEGGQHDDAGALSDPEAAGHAEIFGLWVTPAARGTGVATALADAAADRARADGSSHLVYWVSTDNGRAVAFASGLGFRPTDFRRPMRGLRHADEQEIAMVLALGVDRGGASAPPAPVG